MIGGGGEIMRWSILSAAVMATSLFLSEPISAQGQAGPDCILSHTIGGQVTVNRADAAPAQVIKSDDLIETRTNSRATLRCGTELTVVIGPESRVKASALMAPDAQSPSMRVLNGLVGFILDSFGGARFRVEMPSAVAAVRSTEWTIETDGRKSALFVREGRVSVIGRANSAVLTATEGVNISPEGRLAGVRNWGPGRIAGQSQRLGDDW